MGKQSSFAGILFILALTLGACSSTGEGAAQGINVGNEARGFSLEALDGTQVSLHDYAGKAVLINFWATWCEPCRDEIPDLQAAYEAHQDEGLVVLGVNVEETREAVKPYVDSLGVTYPVLLDESGQVFKTYRGLGLPMSIFVDPAGVIQVRHIGYLSADQLQRYLDKSLP